MPVEFRGSARAQPDNGLVEYGRRSDQDQFKSTGKHMEENKEGCSAGPFFATWL